MSINISNGATISQALTKILDNFPQTGLDFEYCAIKKAHTKTFILANNVGAQVQFEILINDKNEQKIFDITPKSGFIKSGLKQEFVVKFAPQEAKVTIASAVFKLRENKNEISKVLKLSGIGKFPFITSSVEKIDFESLTVGKTDQKPIKLRNNSQVEAEYKIVRVNDDGKDSSIILSCYEGKIPPNGSEDITVTFEPKTAGLVTNTTFSINVLGGNEIKIATTGQANAIEISLSTKSIHFGEVQLTQSTNRLLNIINDSDQPTSFQFFTDKSNVFSFSKIEGVIPPKSQARIIIEFFPQQTLNYYERVFCVVRNHQVMYVDLIGTCFDLLTKPMPLMQRHVDIYRHRVIMGVHSRLRKDKLGESLGHSPERVESEVKAMIMENSENFSKISAAEFEMNQEIPIDDPTQVVLHKEMFLDICNSVRDIRLESDFLDFQFTDSGRVSEPKTLILENKHPFSININWCLLDVYNQTTQQWVKNPFKVRPANTKIEANSTQAFNFEFIPYEPDQYFFQMAQCFIQLNNGALSKNKRLIAQEQQRLAKSKKKSTTTYANILLGNTKQNKFEDAVNEEIDPPQCLSLRMVGHSFPPGSQPFIPMIKLNPSHQVKFPACGPHESVYETVQIQNNSDTPVYYKILQDSTKTFKAFPSYGLIRGKSFGLVCFEFTPNQAREFNFNSQFIFNHNPTNIQKINLVGYCYEPGIVISNQAKLFFPPIYKGVSQKQQFNVQNTTRIPLHYEWKVPDKYKNEVQFTPSKAYLLPNEDVRIIATFTPLKKKDYHITVPIYAKNIYDHIKNSIGFFNPGSGLMQRNQNQTVPVNMIKKYTIDIIGRGSDGGVQIKPSSVDFGTITVGFSKTMDAVIYNNSNCNIYIELKMAPKIKNIEGQSKYNAKELNNLAKVLSDNFSFDTPKGIINAKSKKTISIIFKPQLRFDFDINMVCIAREKLDNQVAHGVGANRDGYIEQVVEKSFITVSAKGDYPLLRFEDVRNDTMSIANLWERFQMTKMNKELLMPLNEKEKIFNNSDQTNQSMDDLTSNLTTFSWDFGKIPIKFGSKPKKVALTLKNIGGVQANWQFKLPNDSEIKMEPWADPGEPTPEKAFEKHILDNKIFNVQPRKGSLMPGEQMELNVFYYPKEVKKHHLKTFLQILNGKPLIINFQGETLHRRAYLRLLKEIYYMPPIPIGLEWAVTYPIEIKNLGITKLKYQIDTAALEALNSKNYNFRIFDIQNPEGTLAANDTQYIYTLFRPLEAKEYSVDLPIKISDIEGPSPHSHILKLRASGYHPSQVLDKPQEVQFYEDLPVCRAYVGGEGQMAAFSYESIDFGELESGQIANRFVILYNLHQTQKLKFEFQKSGLMCGDNLKLEPMSGELEPNTHQNIKMSLIPARFPTHFEGEIQCSIEWDNPDEEKAEMKSLHTNTNVNENQEYLFLRLKKRTKFRKENAPVEARDNENLFSNVLNEMINDILTDEEMNQLLDKCHQTTDGGILTQVVTSDQEPPSCEKIYKKVKTPKMSDLNPLKQQEVYQESLKELTGNEEDDLLRKTFFLDQKFTDMLEYMLEDTIFNLMEEATYEEFDLMQAPKIYIRKDQIQDRN